MKFRHFVMLCIAVLLLVAGSYGGIYLQHVLRFGRKIPPDIKQRYEFRYVGVEKFSNVFVTYRFDNFSGDIDRFTYNYYDEKKDSKGEIEFPAFESVGMIRLKDGTVNDIVTENYRDMLRVHFNKIAKQQKDKKSPTAGSTMTP